MRLIEEKHLRVLNTRGQPETYARRGMGSSNIDVTLSRGMDPERKVRHWSVINGVTDSDHRVIKYEVVSQRSRTSPQYPHHRDY